MKFVNKALTVVSVLVSLAHTLVKLMGLKLITAYLKKPLQEEMSLIHNNLKDFGRYLEKN